MLGAALILGRLSCEPNMWSQRFVDLSSRAFGRSKPCDGQSWFVPCMLMVCGCGGSSRDERQVPRTRPAGSSLGVVLFVCDRGFLLFVFPVYLSYYDLDQ